ncbi:hypothetical protein DFJ43DRAFT_580088 [Lentinula guzmanii]|uniref:F-box domain-containing protein n=1 Tax=Lentinula guzmanii TaxID=2804957 RepID=A0AA38JDX2_9AGAR|nr:hypothetical protein DFJ43DRAFT_580088 [Lentinula guzmanii]
MISNTSTGAGPSGAGRAGGGAPTREPTRAQLPEGAREVSVDQYLHLMLERDPWTPRPLTPEETVLIRHQCVRLLASYLRQEAYNKVLKTRIVKTAEERERHIADIREREGHAVKTYIAYQLIYWRTFRIHDLPMEILSNIIRYVVWSAPSPPIGIRWRLQLTWVSRYLRHAAISDPTLWNAVWFRDNPPFERSLAFVERSGISPLDLRINDTEARKFTDEEVCALLKALTPHLHHIRMLIILLDNWEPILSVLKWLSDYGKEADRSLTMERFEIHRTGNPYIWPGTVYRGARFDPVNHTVSLYSLFGGKYVSELKSFTMNGVYIDWANTPSLENLTTLDLRRIPLELCPSLPRFRQILCSSPMLTKLSLDGAGPASNPTGINNYPAINLPHLQTLVLANFTAPFSKSIVSHFTAPNVKDLTIMNFKGFNYGPFYEFMIGRFRKIKLLTLYTTNCPIDILPTVIKWLDSMPLLAYARLAALEHDILQAFLFDPETMEVHPSLTPEMRKTFGIVEDLAFTKLTAPSKEALEDKDRAPRLVNPRLNVLEVQNIRPEAFAKFIGARKLCGIPVKKTYMAKNMLADFHPDLLRYIRENIDGLMIVDMGAKTQEEEELLNEP